MTSLKRVLRNLNFNTSQLLKKISYMYDVLWVIGKLNIQVVVLHRSEYIFFMAWFALPLFENLFFPSDMLGTFVKVFFRVFIRLIGGILLEGKHQKNVLNLTFGVRFLIFRYPNFEFIDYFFFRGYTTTRNLLRNN